MNARNRITTVLALAAVAMATVAFTASSARAQLSTELGILDLAANGGINPATGVAWQAGDQYRFIFATSQGRDATSTNITDYNNFVQGLADVSPLGLSLATWNALGSTQTVDARDNTSTNIGVDGTGESIFLLNGTEVIATDYADFYPNHAGGVNIDISETGGTPFDGGDFTSNWTGSNGSGVAKVSGSNFGGDNWLGSTDGGDGPVPTSQTGLWGTGSAAQWIDRFNIDNTDIKGLYGLSDPLTITGPAPPPAAAVPEPATLIIAALGLLGMGWLGWRRRKRA